MYLSQNLKSFDAVSCLNYVNTNGSVTKEQKAFFLSSDVVPVAVLWHFISE